MGQGCRLGVDPRLYLVHEIFVSELARQDGARPLISAFKPCLVWMVRPHLSDRSVFDA